MNYKCSAGCLVARHGHKMFCDTAEKNSNEKNCAHYATVQVDDGVPAKTFWCGGEPLTSKPAPKPQPGAKPQPDSTLAAEYSAKIKTLSSQYQVRVKSVVMMLGFVEGCVQEHIQNVPKVV